MAISYEVPAENKEAFERLRTVILEAITQEHGTDRSAAGASMDELGVRSSLNVIGSIAAQLVFGYSILLNNPAAAMQLASGLSEGIMNLALQKIPEAQRPSFDEATSRWMNPVGQPSLNEVLEAIADSCEPLSPEEEAVVAALQKQKGRTE